MQKPSEDQVLPDGRITIGRKWIALRSGLWTIAFLIGAVVSAAYGMWVISIVLLIFFVLSAVLLVIYVKSKP